VKHLGCSVHARGARSWLALASLLALGACTFGAPTGDGTGDDGEATGEAAERPPVEYKKDGSVAVGEIRYGSVAEFQGSADFRDNGRRCASEDVPVFAAFDASDCSYSQTVIQGDYQPSTVYTIPVVFHVIEKTDGTGHISEALLHSQIDVLNEDYQALAASLGAQGHDGRIRFALATVDPSGNPTTGIEYVTSNSYFKDPGPGNGNPMKTALHWDTHRYLNLYTNDASGALGYATFPSQSAGNVDDGVVLLYTSVGRDAPQGGVYDQGRTATHEIGHYLGLFHTFQGGCGSASSPYGSGDLIADTVAHPGPDFECTAGQSSCGGGLKPIDNYMNYTNDTCMSQFSPEQINRMRCSLVHYRSDLFSSSGGGTSTSNEPPTAAFTVSASGLSVSFSDQSSDSDGTVAAWSWSFGDGASSTAHNPSHSYAAAGTYTVTLTARDDDGATASVSHTVTVAAASSNLLSSGAPVGGLAAATGGELRYAIDVPAGATSLIVSISGGTGDADLYVRRGAEPTTSSYDARPYLTGNNETVTISNPAAARYYVMVQAYAGYSGVTLTAAVGQASQSSAGDTSTISDLSGAAGSEQQFSITVPAGATALDVAIAGGSGDADLYVRRGSAPTATSYDYRPFLNGNDEQVSVAAPEAATWYVMVRGYQAYSGLSLTMSYR
jgi:PKD repeat protein